jgi:hypothetical protein
MHDVLMEIEYQYDFNLNLNLNAGIPGLRCFNDNIRILDYLCFLEMYIPRSKSFASLATLASEFPCTDALDFRSTAL